MHSITTSVIAERSDMPFARSEWVLTPENGGTRIEYRLAMEPGFWVPPVIGPMVIRRKLRSSGLRAAENLERLAREAGNSP